MRQKYALLLLEESPVCHFEIYRIADERTIRQLILIRNFGVSFKQRRCEAV